MYGIIGHPVGHSLSPSMHNNAFEKVGLDSVYVAFDVPSGNLANAVSGIRSLGIRGVNVTIPHKQSVMNLIDQVSDDAILVGAVNTIKNEGGVLVGYNTDVGGFIRALKDDFSFVPTGKKIMMIGAGGAARAVVVGLCNNNASEIVIVNRTVSRAESLSREFSSHYSNTGFKVLALDDDKSIKREIRNCDLIVNTSSAGMKGKNPLSLPLGLFPKESFIYDLVYDPAVTPLVKDARDHGINARSGISMLLYQGVDAFEIWTERKAPVEAMKKALTVKRFLEDME